MFNAAVPSTVVDDSTHYEMGQLTQVTATLNCPRQHSGKHSTHNCKTMGSNPATGAAREKMTKSTEAVSLVLCDPSMNEL